MGKIIDKTKSEIYNIIVDGKEEQATGYEISYHMGYRPTHNFGGKQFTFEEMETLGINAMMVEPNCRHRKFPVVVGVSKPRLDPDELKRLEEIEFAKYNFNGRKYNLYELMQLQRRYEREMRENFNETLRWQTWDRLRSQVHAKRFEVQLDKYFDLTEMMFDVTGRADDMFDFLGDLMSEATQDNTKISLNNRGVLMMQVTPAPLPGVLSASARIGPVSAAANITSAAAVLPKWLLDKLAEVAAKIVSLVAKNPPPEQTPLPEPMSWKEAAAEEEFKFMDFVEIANIGKELTALAGSTGDSRNRSAIRGALDKVAFETADKAAEAFGAAYYNLSNDPKEKQEYGAHIVEYTYGEIKWYSIETVRNSADLKQNRDSLSGFPIPESKTTSFIHTHPNFYNSENHNYFSEYDIEAFKLGHEAAFYLVIPNGNIYKMTEDNIDTYYLNPVGNINNP